MAEYGWGLPDELVQKARRELNELPETREQAIQAVREQIHTRQDINFLRTDDSFILRFLRARKFNPFEAFKLLSRYFEYRQNNKILFDKFQACEPGVQHALSDSLPGVLPKTDHYGRHILVLFAANWDITKYNLASIYRAILLTLEKLIADEENQINGFVMIVDWTQFTFRQSTWISPKVMKLMIEGLQDCFPARFGGIHFINQPWFVEGIFKLVRPFLKDKAKDKVFMHGNNVGTLFNHIHKESLPAELGGNAPPYNTKYWAEQLIGDGSFSFGQSQIFWPGSACCSIATSGRNRSKSESIDMKTLTEEKNDRNTPSPQHRKSGFVKAKTLDLNMLDEELFLIE